jgi:hypothetical protein
MMVDCPFKRKDKTCIFDGKVGCPAHKFHNLLRKIKWLNKYV